MSLTPARLAEFDQMVAGHAQRLDQLVASFYSNPFIHTDVERIVTLALMLTRNPQLTRDDVADLATLAIKRLADSEPGRAERYRLAWVSARQRAANHLAALVEADTERDYLRGRLRERDDEVAQLVAENADFKGLVR